MLQTTVFEIQVKFKYGGNLLGDSDEHGITNDLNQFSILIFTSHEPFRIALERKYES